MFKKIFSLLLLSSTVFADKNLHAVHLSAEDFNLYWLIPFMGILLSIAIIPLLKPRFWHHHYGKVSAFWAASFLTLFSIYFTDFA